MQRRNSIVLFFPAGFMQSIQVEWGISDPPPQERGSSKVIQMPPVNVLNSQYKNFKNVRRLSDGGEAGEGEEKRGQGGKGNGSGEKKMQV